jgi:hypothetical protein
MANASYPIRTVRPCCRPPNDSVGSSRSSVKALSDTPHAGGSTMPD